MGKYASDGATWSSGCKRARRLGNQAACRAAQLAYSRSEFWEKIALPQVKRLGLTEALSHATLFDTAIQQGGLGRKRMKLVEDAMSAQPGMSEEQIRAQISKAATSFMGNSGFKDDVRSRRETFIDGTGRVHGKTYNLSHWGLVAAFELLVVTPAISNLIREGKTFRINSAIQTGKKYGMQLLDDSLFDLWHKGLVKKDDVIMKSENPGELTARIHRAERGMFDEDEGEDEGDSDEDEFEAA